MSHPLPLIGPVSDLAQEIFSNAKLSRGDDTLRKLRPLQVPIKRQLFGNRVVLKRCTSLMQYQDIKVPLAGPFVSGRCPEVERMAVKLLRENEDLLLKHFCDIPVGLQ